jgi:hypothetical protein
MTKNFLRTLIALFLFGVAFAFVEAAVVVYLRALYEPLHERFYPGHTASDLFPLIRLDQLDAAGPAPERWLLIELVRETATLILLAAVGLAIGINFRQGLAAFLVAFGLWDIFYYVFLKILIDWPASLFEWDLLFLLPLPWAGPVVAPVLVALMMIACGSLVLWRESAGRPLHAQALHWAAIFGGGVILVVAFCWDYQNLMAGGLPNPFPWPLFTLGLAMSLAAFGHAWWVSRIAAPEPLARTTEPGLADLQPSRFA